MTAEQAARLAWERNPRQMTPAMAAALSVALPDGNEEEGREAA